MENGNLTLDTADRSDWIATAMKNNNQNAIPDFLVHWRDESKHFTESVYYSAPAEADINRSSEKLRNKIATLHTNTTHIEVSEVVWAEPTTITVMTNRVCFCLVITSTTSVEYGYGRKAARSTGLGSVLFMLPGKEIRGHSPSGTIRIVICSFDRAYAESVVGPLDRLSEPQLLNALDVRSSLTSAILLRLMHEAIHPGPLSTAVIESMGHTLLVECAHWLLINDSNPQPEGRLTARDFGIMDQYLAGLSGESPSVAELAAACGFSERHFAKLFRQKTGYSVAQYIKSAQIAKAKTYLLETDLPLKEIAHRLGFSTPANFSFAFRAATGITPGKFRKT